MFGRIEKEIKGKKLMLRALLDSIEMIRGVKKEKELREDIENLITKEEIMWAQKARCEWIVKADRNTRYFQIIAKQRRARNRILNLKCENGNLSENIDEIGRVLVNHFKHRFTETNSRTT